MGHNVVFMLTPSLGMEHCDEQSWFTFSSDGFGFVIFLVDTAFICCPINAEESDITLVIRSLFKCQNKASETKIIMAALPGCSLSWVGLMADEMDKLIKSCLSGYDSQV